jgi:hypothetical protein
MRHSIQRSVTKIDRKIHEQCELHTKLMSELQQRRLQLINEYNDDITNMDNRIRGATPPQKDDTLDTLDMSLNSHTVMTKDNSKKLENLEKKFEEQIGGRFVCTIL